MTSERLFLHTQTHKVCVLEVDLTRPKRLGSAGTTDGRRLHTFLESAHHAAAGLIQREDCGARGLGLLSFRVISSHVRIRSPVDEL